ncbi:MAG TPA: N-acetylmuramoyl-L-alanine amidase [Myxococcales bacterium]|jgi:N-acetylmuramoyl-L-alanine amidase
MLRSTLCSVCLLILVPLAARADDAGPAAVAAAPQEAVGGSGAAAAPRLDGLTVFLDAGHGGKLDGAVGAKGEKEKNVALAVVKRLREELVKAGAKVLVSRSSDVDVDLWERMTKANDAKADLFVSIHCNAMPFGRVRAVTHGIETYFLSAETTDEQAQRVVAQENGEAKRLKRSTDPLANILDDLAQTEAHHDASAFAYAVHQRLIKDLGAADRGVQQAPFIVLMGAQMPAILVEVGFISHPEESKKLSDKDYQGRLASSLVDGLGAFVEENGKHLKAADAPASKAVEPKKAAEAPAR